MLQEQGLEKDLLLDQLTRASDKIRTRALSEREKTLDTAKTVSYLWLWNENLLGGPFL